MTEKEKILLKHKRLMETQKQPMKRLGGAVREVTVIKRPALLRFLRAVGVIRIGKSEAIHTLFTKVIKNVARDYCEQACLAARMTPNCKTLLSSHARFAEHVLGIDVTGIEPIKATRRRLHEKPPQSNAEPLPAVQLDA